MCLACVWPWVHYHHQIKQINSRGVLSGDVWFPVVNANCYVLVCKSAFNNGFKQWFGPWTSEFFIWTARVSQTGWDHMWSADEGHCREAWVIRWRNSFYFSFISLWIWGETFKHYFSPKSSLMYTEAERRVGRSTLLPAAPQELPPTSQLCFPVALTHTRCGILE